MKLALVESWTTVLWHSFSTRLNAIGLLILGWFQVDPVSVLSVWNSMPAVVRENLPPRFVLWVGMACFALSMLSRIVRQPKMAAKIEEKSNGPAC